MAKVNREANRSGVTTTGLRALAVAVCMVFMMNFSQVRADEEKPAPPAEDKPTASLSVDILSQYLYRGVALSADSVVVQPFATFGYKGLTLMVWGNFDTSEKLYSGHERWNETDFTISYSREIVKGLTGIIGYTYYGVVNATDDTNEFFFGLSYAFPWFTVGITTWREFHAYPGWWVQLDLSRNFKLPWYAMSVDVGASFGYLDSNPQDFADIHSGQVLAALNIPIHKYITISPRVGFAFPLTENGEDNIEFNSWDGQGSHVFGGIRLVASF